MATPLAARERIAITRCLRCHVQRRHASATTTVPAVPIDEMHQQIQPIVLDPAGGPESFKPAFLRKTQLHRQYTSLLRSTPLMLLFQHNNLKAIEWVAIRRELSSALAKVSATSSSPVLSSTPDPAKSVRIQTIHSGVFGAALRVVEFHHPDPISTAAEHDSTIPLQHQDQSQRLTPQHSLSKEAYMSTLHPKNIRLRNPSKKWKFSHSPRAHLKKNTPLHRLLHGPIAVLVFPSVTPQHLAAAISILAPTPGNSSAFPAPRRKTNPTYYEANVQTGLRKLLLLGARVEGQTMDGEGIKWIGGLAKSGGLEGLRAQLVSLLQSVGGGITGALESASRSLWITMEGRRTQLEEEEKDGNGKEES